jgi:cell division protein FtsI (penicillin-binding protein 3)
MAENRGVGMKGRGLRYGSVIALLGCCAVLVLARYGSLAVSTPESRASAEVEIERGAITDRSGRILAMDSPLYNLAIWRPETDKAAFASEAERLSEMAEISEKDLVERWSGDGSDFFYIKKRIQPHIARAVQEAKAGGAFKGVVVEKVAGRLYPEKRLASHLVGFVGDGNRGLAGVENRYDSDLLPVPAPSKGEIRVGNGIELSIDSDMQFLLEETARKAYGETEAQAVIMIAADARTGELLAYVSMPDFDPNDYSASPPENWYDWPSVYAFEPGSVFKVFTMAAAVEAGGVDSRSTFVCDGAYRRILPSGEKITIKCLGAHGTVDIEKILEYSCNAGAGYAADTVDSFDFYDKLRAFGFGARTGVALAGETPGLFAEPGAWSLRTRPTIGMGQEILVSALQMTAAAVAIANDGVLLKPIAVRRLLGPDGSVVYENSPQPVRRVVSSEAARAILSAMETASSETGTGKRAKVKDVRMAVKTGTAQMIDPATKRYSEKDFIASTLAILPADAPRIVLYLAIVKPRAGDSYYGGRIAAPVVKEAAEAILAISNLPRGESPSAEKPTSIVIPAYESASIGETMPDLHGVPKRLLIPLLGREDLVVKIQGDGYVARQSPLPGQPVSPGTEIVLELE